MLLERVVLKVCGCMPQAPDWQVSHGNASVEDPLSKMTDTVCAGVPTPRSA
jgi:hypothetical protein